MSLIRQNDMVRIKGVNGFGFVKEIIYCSQSFKTLFAVNVQINGVYKENELVLLDCEDCELYRADSSKARRIYAHPLDHQFYASLMAESEAEHA